MTIEAAIAHAIHIDLDIIQALPEVQETPVDRLEEFIESYIKSIQASMVEAALSGSWENPEELYGVFQKCGVDVPDTMLRTMSDTVCALHSQDIQEIGCYQDKFLNFVTLSL